MQDQEIKGDLDRLALAPTTAANEHSSVMARSPVGDAEMTMQSACLVGGSEPKIVSFPKGRSRYGQGPRRLVEIAQQIRRNLRKAAEATCERHSTFV